MNLSPMELFLKESPEVANAFNNLIKSLIELKGLDAKTKQLIYIAMKTATSDETAVKAHIPMVKALGATREEVVETILLTLTVSGISGVLKILPLVIEEYDHNDS